MSTAHQEGVTGQLVHILRTQGNEILGDWEQAARSLAVFHDRDHPTLIDNLPSVLDGVAHIVEDIDLGRTPERPLSSAGIQVVDHLARGFDLEQVVGELALLRDCILARVREETDRPALPALNHAIDAVVGASIIKYMEAYVQTLQEFDRIVNLAVEKGTVEELLDGLLRVLLDRATPDVHTAAILLRDGDVLRVSAAVGIARDPTFSIRIGEGFAGLIAATGQPRMLASAATDSLPVNPALRAAGIRALYGVPLVDERGEVIGVAHIGSRTVSKIAPLDRELLQRVAARASAAIHQHVLRERAEHSLRDLEERVKQLQTLADNIPQLAWMTDPAGAMFWFNRRWFEFTGLTLEEARGSGWEKVQHPDHVACVIEKFERARAVGEVWEDTFQMRAKEGYYRWFLTRAVPIRDEAGNLVQWFGTNTDVTTQRCLSEATKLLGMSLDYQETLEKLAYVAVPDLADWCVVDIIENDMPRRIAVAHVDPKMVALAHGWSRTHPPNWSAPRGVARVLRTGEPEVFQEITDELLAQVARDAENLVSLREFRPTSMLSVPLINRGTTIGALTLVTTESGRHYQKSDLDVASELGRRAAVAIDNARLYREAQDAIRLREQTLAIVSHDLRNPLTGIDIAASMVLEDPTLEPDTRKRVEIIVRSTNRMERMIGDLLDLARIQSGTLSLERSLHDAESLVIDSLELNEIVAREKGVTIVRELDVSGVYVMCDRQRIDQVLANLISNAIKFCSAGDTVCVRATRDGDRVRYTVADTGPGIPEAQLAHVFEPYASGRGKEGLGLGLYISRGIVEAHDGQLTVESTPGSGATFVMSLPAASPPH